MAANVNPIEVYVISSPSGEKITVPRELFLALRDFVGGGKPNGTIEIDCRNGGIAGVRGTKAYK